VAYNLYFASQIYNQSFRGGLINLEEIIEYICTAAQHINEAGIRALASQVITA
jgi:hypothetical protein